MKQIEEKLVEHLVNRFLGWPFPKDFHPDGGIMFRGVYDNGTEEGGKFEPIGTNLLNAEQAKEMFRYILEYDDGTSVLQSLLTSEAKKREETVKGKAIIITAELDRKFFKGRFSSSGLESIEKIIEETLTTPPTQEADQADYKK